MLLQGDSVGHKAVNVFDSYHELTTGFTCFIMHSLSMVEETQTPYYTQQVKSCCWFRI